MGTSITFAFSAGLIVFLRNFGEHLERLLQIEKKPRSRNVLAGAGLSLLRVNPLGILDLTSVQFAHSSLHVTPLMRLKDGKFRMLLSGVQTLPVTIKTVRFGSWPMRSPSQLCKGLRLRSLEWVENVVKE